MTTKLKVPANKEIEAIALLLSQGNKIENRTIIDNETNILLACNLKEAFDVNKYPDYFRLISDYSKYFNCTYPSIGNIPAMLFQNNYDCTNFKNTISFLPFILPTNSILFYATVYADAPRSRHQYRYICDN